MSQSSAAVEPSMEEILASIRRIIADEDPTQRAEAAPSPPRVEPGIEHASPPPSAAPLDEDVLDLAMAATEAASMAREDQPALPPEPAATAAPQATPAQPRQEPPVDPKPARPAMAPRPEPEMSPLPRAEPLRSPYQEPLLSPETSEDVSAAFSSLSHAILPPEPRTIEDLTRDLLRPMLREWLDDNLPPLVERLVREEIERVARGRR